MDRDAQMLSVLGTDASVNTVPAAGLDPLLDPQGQCGLGRSLYVSVMWPVKIIRSLAVGGDL